MTSPPPRDMPMSVASSTSKWSRTADTGAAQSLRMVSLFPLLRPGVVPVSKSASRAPPCPGPSKAMILRPRFATAARTGKSSSI